jgi:hypothetical protein
VILTSVEPQFEHSRFSSALGREDDYSVWEERSISALHEMYENEGWIAFQYVDNNQLYDAVDLDPNLILENKHELVVQMTRRGHVFLKSGRNPASRHGSTTSPRRTKPSQIPRKQSIPDIVRMKERRYRKPKNAEEAREQIAASIAGRRGQQAFRQQLLHVYQRCLVTGCDAADVLEAAHIQAFSEDGTFEVSNGLLLRADIHTLFDLGFIAVNTPDMTVITADALKNTVYGNLNGRKLLFPPGKAHVPNRDALEAHRLQSMMQQQKTRV